MRLLKRVYPPPTHAEILADPEGARRRLIAGYRAMIHNGRALALCAALAIGLLLLVSREALVNHRWLWLIFDFALMYLNGRVVALLWVFERDITRQLTHLEAHENDWTQVPPPRLRS